MNRLLVVLTISVAFTNAQALPEIAAWTTQKGVKVFHVQAPELAMIDLALTFDAGSARDNKLPGLSVMMHSLLDKGTGTLTANDVAARFEDVGAQFSSSVSLDRSNLSLRTLSEQALFKEALEMFIAVVARPSFPERDFNRERKRLLIALQDREQRPSKIVEENFYKSLYQNHPYAHSRDGSKETISKISLKDIRRFHNDYIVAANAVLAIVGDISNRQAKALAEDISAALPASQRPKKVNDARKIKTNSKHIDFPSQQAHVRIGQIGIERGNPDYFSLYVGNHILGGGGFTSRLVEEVRSKRGLSYSVYSYFIPYQQAGPFVLGLQTRSDQAEQAVAVCHQVLADYIEHGPSQQELALSKQSIINGFPLRIDSNRDILGYLSLIGYYDLPLTYLNDFKKNIEQVSLRDVKRAFRKHLDPDAFITVIVGSEQTARQAL